MIKKTSKITLLLVLAFFLISIPSFTSAILIPAWFNSSGDIQNTDYLTSGLRSGYKLDDLGNNVLDSVRGENGTNGTGLIKGDTGIINYSYSFEKSTSQKITLSAPYPTEDRMSYSFSIWFYWTQKNETEDWLRVLNDQTSYMQLMFVNSTKQLEFNPQGASIYTDVNSIPINSWVNVVVTCKDDGAGNGNFSIWINGKLNVSAYQGQSCMVGGSGRPIDIVQSSWGGKVDEIYFWNRTLNNSEVFDISEGLTFSYYSPIYTATSLLPINDTRTNQVINYTADIYCSSGCANSTLYFKNSTDTIYSVFTDLTGIKNIELGYDVNLSAYGSDGIYDWYYELTDIYNQITTSEERRILIDINAPYINWNDPNTTTLTYTTNYLLDIGVTDIMLNDVNLTIFNATGSIIYNNYTIDINLSTFQISDVIPLDEGENSVEVYVIDQVLIEITDTKIIERDTTSPIISITYPTAINYGIAPTGLDYTYAENNCDVAWYSNDGGITNSTSVLCGENFTGLTAFEGSNTWIVYMRDLVGNEGSSSITFNYAISYKSSSIYQILNEIGIGVYFLLFGTSQGIGIFLTAIIIISIIAIIGYAIVRVIPDMIKKWQMQNER